MKSVFALGQYATSRDYEQLADLAKEGGVICVVDNWQMEGVRDVAQTVFMSKNGQELYYISGRGISYVTTFSREEFLLACQQTNVEFLLPLKASAAATPPEGDGLLSRLAKQASEVRAQAAAIAAKWWLQARNRNNLAGEATAISIGHEIDGASFVAATEDPELQRHVSDWMRKIDQRNAALASELPAAGDAQEESRRLDFVICDVFNGGDIVTAALHDEDGIPVAFDKARPAIDAAIAAAREGRAS